MTFQAYHGVTGAQHQTNFNNLSTHGYRMISLSVYGDPNDARYAAVWVQRPGPAWVAVHGVDSAGYQSFFNNWTAKGFVPVIVSATGAISNAIFAAVFEQGIVGAWFARHGMTSGPVTTANTFQHFIKTASDSKMILRSVAIYGAASDRRYAAVWHANPQYVKWHVHPSDTGSSYQTVFDAETQLPGYSLHARTARRMSSATNRCMLGLQGRCRRTVGRAPRVDVVSISDGIRHAERGGLLSNLRSRWRIGLEHMLRGDLREAGRPLEPRVDDDRHRCADSRGARSRDAVVHAGQRRPRRAARGREERRHEVLACAHVGRARVSSRSRRIGSCSRAAARCFSRPRCSRCMTRRS